MLVFTVLASASETVVLDHAVWVRATADVAAERIGRIAAGTPFTVVDRLEGPGCATWARLEVRGFACMEEAHPTGMPVPTLPVLVEHAPPHPADFEGYLETGAYPPASAEPLLPFVYGRIWRRWKGRTWTDADAWLSGDPPTGALPSSRRARFVGVVPTERGDVLVREDGVVVPAEEVYLFPITRFVGRDLSAKPLEAGRRPAWVVEYAGLEVAGPGGDAVAMPYHTAFEVAGEPSEGLWTAWVDGTEVRVPDDGSITVWRPAGRPDGVGAQDRWLDVDTDTQTLALLDGDTPRFVTLVSTGLWRTPTPKGVYRITDKMAYADMRSRVGARDAYHVEAVPWVMHFKPRYALHGAYWHWGFGHRASHGCINLAPRDAAWLFEALEPELPAGWHSVYADAEWPGTWLRVR